MEWMLLTLRCQSGADLALPELCLASSDASPGLQAPMHRWASVRCQPAVQQSRRTLACLVGTLVGRRCHCPAAHSKAGDLPKVLQTFEEMVSKVSTSMSNHQLLLWQA